MTPTVKSGLVLAAVFFFGGVTGSGLTRFLAGKKVHDMLNAPAGIARQRLYIATLDREVHLDKEQRQKIRGILQASEGELREANRECVPKQRNIRKKTLEEVRGVMRKDQLDGFEQFADKVEKIGKAVHDDAPPAPPTRL